jgi:hypothetical protein
MASRKAFSQVCPLFHHRAVDEVLVEHARMDARRRALRHEDADEPFFRVDPEARAPGPCPHRVAL